MDWTEAEIRTLTGCFFFRGLTPTELKYLLQQVPVRRDAFARGSSIYEPEHFRKELGILLSGRIRVSKGGGSLVVSVLEPGEIFGAAALFNEESLYVSRLTAITPCQILFFSQEIVSRLMIQDNRLAENYIRYLSGRIRFLSRKVDVLIQASGQRKLVQCLLDAADERGEIRLSCSLSELAARLNMSRAALYRELGKLEEAGLLLRRGKLLQLLRREDWALLIEKG